MAVAMWVIGLVLVALLMGASTWAMTVGIIGGFSGRRLEKCPRCHRYGLTSDRLVHSEGCPTTREEQLRQLLVGPRHLRLHHR